MKTKKIFWTILVASLFMFGGCTSSFTDYNTDPESVLETDVPLPTLYLTAQQKYLTSGHAWNGIWASKFRWMQFGSTIYGYGNVQYQYFMPSIGNSVYSEFIEMGGLVTSINYLAARRETPEIYEGIANVSRVLLIAKAIQASDMFGSLAYSEGWGARRGLTDRASLEPKFDTQQELIEIWDKELKEVITNLKAQPSKNTSLEGYDRAYNGDISKWIKAANGIRLRLATRIWNVMPDKAKEIASEVLAPANAQYIFSSNDDSFILWFDKKLTQSGDWHSSRDMVVATRAVMNYYHRNKDPRIKIFYIKNHITPERLKAFNEQQEDDKNKLPEDLTAFEGSTIVYDKISEEVNRKNPAYYYPKPGDGNYTHIYRMLAANRVNARLWKGNDRYNLGGPIDGSALSDGNGGNSLIVMTYPEFCLLASEFTLRMKINTGKSAQDWYETGVKSSLDQWNYFGKYNETYYYEPFTDEEIKNFMNHSDVKWDNSNALEQIYAQLHIENYKNSDEGWAQWKRTNYPNTGTTIFKFEQPMIGGDTNQRIPRKVRFVAPNTGVHNYVNLLERIETMEKDPKFGDRGSEHGRLWWDEKPTNGFENVVN